MREIDLNKNESSVKIKQIKENSIAKRIKTKILLWKTNFNKTPFSHKIIILLIILILTGLISFAFIYIFILAGSPSREPIDASYELLRAQSKSKGFVISEIPSPPQVKDQENPLNGELFTVEEYEKFKDRTPITVMIENSIDARPQAGLSSANIVYETLAESGITRFMAVFWSHDAQKVGPIRSVRTYFLDWISEYDDPPLANIGQAGYEPWEEVIVPEADARAYMNKYNIKSYDRYGRNVYWRDYDKFHSGIAWEHVAYSETETLWADAGTMGWNEPANITPFKFKKDIAYDERPNSQEIEIIFMSYGSNPYKVNWIYDPLKNNYKRNLADEPHIDENNNKQITPKNVIVEYCAFRQTGDRNGRIVLTTIGEGDASIFIDGKQIDGTWKKENRTTRTMFYDSEGNEIELNRGQIWIDVVPKGVGKVTVE